MLAELERIPGRRAFSRGTLQRLRPFGAANVLRARRPGDAGAAVSLHRSARPQDVERTADETAQRVRAPADSAQAPRSRLRRRGVCADRPGGDAVVEPRRAADGLNAGEALGTIVARIVH